MVVFSIEIFDQIVQFQGFPRAPFNKYSTNSID